jgi:hypothetical protein
MKRLDAVVIVKSTKPAKRDVAKRSLAVPEQACRASEFAQMTRFDMLSRNLETQEALN